jgi:hypothetical protein
VQCDARLGGRRQHPLDTGGNVDRLDVGEPANLWLLELGKENGTLAVTGHAGILITDRSGEELDEVARSMLSGIGNHYRHDRILAASLSLYGHTTNTGKSL